MDKSKLGGALGSFGVLAGLLYGVKNQKSIGIITLYALGFGLAGMIVGNAVTKFYE
jgi:hypothetical protein